MVVLQIHFLRCDFFFHAARTCVSSLYYFIMHFIIIQTWNLSIEDEEIKKDPESKQMACANANPVNLSHKQL